MNKKNKNVAVMDFDGCQLPCVPKFSVASADTSHDSLIISIKRSVRSPWLLYYKSWLKKFYYSFAHIGGPTTAEKAAKTFAPAPAFVNGDRVRVRSREEILTTLDPFGGLKGCTFFHEMFEYCGTEQRIFKVMKNFMDERDYKYKKTRGIILLENNYCSGKSAFGNCDRCCFLFWREEWLEKIV